MFHTSNKSNSNLILLLLALTAPVRISAFAPQGEHTTARPRFSKGYKSLLESTSFATIGNHTTDRAYDKSPIATLKEILSKLSGSSSIADSAASTALPTDSDASSHLPHVVSAVLGDEDEAGQEVDSTGISRGSLEEMGFHEEHEQESSPSPAPTSLPVDDSIDAHVIVGKVSDMYLQGVGGDFKPKKRSGPPVAPFPVPVDDSIDAHVVEGKVSDLYVQGVGGGTKKEKKTLTPSAPVQIPVDDSIDAHVIHGKVSDMFLQGVGGGTKTTRKMSSAPSPPIEVRVDNFAGDFTSMSPQTKSKETYPAAVSPPPKSKETYNAAMTLDVEARPVPEEASTANGAAVAPVAPVDGTRTAVKPGSPSPGGALTVGTQARRPLVGGLAIAKPASAQVAMTPPVRSKKTYPAALTVGSSKGLNSAAFAAALVELPVDNVFPAQMVPAYLTKSRATYPGALTLGGAAMGKSGYAAAMVQLPVDNMFAAQYTITPAAKSKETYPAALSVRSSGVVRSAGYASALVDNIFHAQYAITPAPKSKKTYPSALTVGFKNSLRPGVFASSLVEWPVDNVFPAQYAMTPAPRSKKTFPGALSMSSKALGTSAYAAALVELPVDRSFDAQYAVAPAAKSKALMGKKPPVVEDVLVEIPVDYTLDDFVPLEYSTISRNTYLTSLSSAGAEKALKAFA